MARTPNKNPRAEDPSRIITRSICLPVGLAAAADRIIAEDPELDFSKYFRRLLREDLARRGVA